MKLVALGLFMISHELLLDAIKRRPLEFFADLRDIRLDRLPPPTPKSRQEVLALDPKGKEDMLRGSIAYLRKMCVIDEDEERAIKDVTDVRNEIAHQLKGMIGGGAMPDLTKHYPIATALTTKIERWWILNVDIATDTDYDGREIDPEEITPGSMMMMDMLGRVALGEGEEAWALYRELEAQRAKQP